MFHRTSRFGRRVKLTLFLGLGLSLATSCATVPTDEATRSATPRGPIELSLLPQPMSVEMQPGSFELEYSHFEVDPGLDDFQVPVEASLTYALHGYRLIATCGHGPDAPVRPVRLSLGGDVQQLGAEGYRLTVSREEVELTAPTAVGLLYGIETLSQLVQQPSEPSSAHGCRVSRSSIDHASPGVASCWTFPGTSCRSMSCAETLIAWPS